MNSQLRLQCPAKTSNTGAYRIAWQGPDGSSYQLMENGEQVYAGPQKASTVTGRPAGAYEYRVGISTNQDGGSLQWSNSCEISVDPPSMVMAIGFFSMGAAVFLATMSLIIWGHRKHKRGELK